MKRFLASIALISLTYWSFAQEIIYSWESPDGYVEEFGGKVTQVNHLSDRCINQKVCDYYVIILYGTYDCFYDEDNSEKSTYIRITLDEGNVLNAGDTIRVTAHRNINKDYASSMFFYYNNDNGGAEDFDTNTWNNLGQISEYTFSGGTETKRRKATEGLLVFDAFPSTNDFIVPELGDESGILDISRNFSEAELYINKIEIIKKKTEANSVSSINKKVSSDKVFTINGVQAEANAKGFLVKGGKKIYMK